jgi:hypothetical protein
MADRLHFSSLARDRYTTQVGNKLEVRQRKTHKLLASIVPPTEWGVDWNWKPTDDGFVIERTGR